MSRVRDAFADGKAFIPFVTAGDPELAVTEELIVAMAGAGAGLIEIGIPFSVSVFVVALIGDGEAGDGYVALGGTQFRIAGHSSGHGNSVQHSFLPLSFIFWISKSQALICL